MKSTRQAWLLACAAGLVLTITAGTPATAAVGATLSPPVVQMPIMAYIGANTVATVFAPTPGAPLPMKYLYQQNGGEWHDVDASPGETSLPLVPERTTNTLRVEAVGRDGSASLSTFDYFYAAVPRLAIDKDLNGDGIVDLVTVGDPAGLGSGLWLAAGTDDRDRTSGRVSAPAVNIGKYGVSGSFLPTDADGGQVLTGRFTGSNAQDILVYRPAGNYGYGFVPGSGVVAKGTGDGSPIIPISGNTYNISSGYLSDINGDDPLELANAYNSSGISPLYPDLLGITGNAGVGYSLEYFQAYPGVLNYNLPTQLSNTTPAGGTDWDNWRIATCLLPSGTAMYLWNKTTGGLYLWEGIHFVDNGDYTGSVTFTQYQIAASWNANGTLQTIEAADFSGDGVPDLWTVTPAGTATAYTVSGLRAAGLATISASASQQVK